eukprot:GHVS01031400.1.p1 GENE.GHVS01031400.1~~GHVS01031400.1.p1  ORF type:complete len:874 (+),score=128.88 GHVS01031400.1:24-2624(+)
MSSSSYPQVAWTPPTNNQQQPLAPPSRASGRSAASTVPPHNTRQEPRCAASLSSQARRRASVAVVWEQVDLNGDTYSQRTGHALTKAGDSFFLFGGTDACARQNDVYCYNPEECFWRCVAGSTATTRTSPPARSGGAVAVAEGVMYLFGGYTKKDGEYFNDIWSFDVEMAQWSRLEPSGNGPSRRTDHTMVCFGEHCLYVFGGFDGKRSFRDLTELNLRGAGTWREVSGQNEPSRTRFGHSAVTHDNSMYVFGGWDGQDTLQELYEYTFPSSVWNKVAERGTAPSGRYRHSAVVMRDRMWVFGGVDRAQKRFADLFMFDMTGGRFWSQVETQGTAPSPRTFHKAGAHGNSMYIFGGFDGQRQNDLYRATVVMGDDSVASVAEMANGGAGGSSPSSRAAVRAASAEREGGDVVMPEDFWIWKTVKAQTTEETYSPRTGHTAVVWNDALYLFGGTDENARQSDIYEYTIRNGKGRWRKIVDCLGTAPPARSGSKAAVYRDSVYLFGGYTKKYGDYFNDVHRYNIIDNCWTCISSLGTSTTNPRARTDHSCVMHNNNMLIFGGFDGQTRFGDLFSLDMEDFVWTLLSEDNATDQSPTERFGHSAIMYDDSMYIFGGWDGHDTLNDLREFSTRTHQWMACSRMGRAPCPRYRHSAVVYGCCMFVFGGVDKRQSRFSDLYEYNMDKGLWAFVRTFGDQLPSPRTFHCAVVYSGNMYVLGGFDGRRLNDMYCLAIPETKPKEEHRRRSPGGGGRGLSDFSACGGGGSCSSGGVPKLERGESQLAPGDDIERAEEDVVNADGIVNLRQKVVELQRRLEATEDRHLCKVCYEHEIDTVLIGCSHRVVCQECARSVNHCPICRNRVREVLITFHP